jgi:putative ABC transport system substrate-binding protein
MPTIFLLSLLTLLTSAVFHLAEAQQPNKLPRIGYLTGTALSANSERVEAFLHGLRELGYVEGKSIFLEWRSAEGKADRLPALVAELVRLKVDIIVTGGPTSNRAAKQATATIPIVMAYDNDPVGNGFVASLARPGGNITGLSTLAPEISGKQLELLREIVPRLSRVAVLGTSNNPGNAQALREIEFAAKVLGVKFQYLDVRDQKDIASVFRDAADGNSDAVLVLAGSIFNSHRTQVIELASKNRLPAIYPYPGYIGDGGLMTYSASFNDLFHRAATYVDKILKGAKPADLPVEQPTKFELVINLKTAKQIGPTNRRMCWRERIG